MTVRIRGNTAWVVVGLGLLVGGCPPPVGSDAGDAGDVRSASDGATDAANDTTIDTPASDGADTSIGDAGDSGIVDVTDAAGDGGTGLAWAACPAPLTGYECSILEVPIDPDVVTRGTTHLAVARRRALLSDRRRGVIFYNPGGPGASGLAGLPSFVTSLAPSAGELLLYYDIVTFDPRGIGQSDAFDCVDDATLQSILTTGTAPGLPAGSTPEAVADYYIAQCRMHLPAGMLENENTYATAYDLDQLRLALGEREINFVGASYGTWLGAVYMKLFPMHVGAFVLDGTIPPGLDGFSRDLSIFTGKEDVLGDFFAWCDATPTCEFRPASGTTRDSFVALRDALTATPLPVSGMRDLVAADLVAGAERFLPAANLTGYAHALAAARDHADGSVLVTALTAPLPIDLEPHAVIWASDSPYPAGTTYAQVTQWETDTLTPAAPFVHSLDVVTAALRLRLPPSAHPIDSLLLDPAVTHRPLLIAGTDDYSTPINGTQPLAVALGDSPYVLTANEWGHVQFPRNRCVRSRLASYILAPDTAPDLTPCQPDFVSANEMRAGCVSATFQHVMSNNRSRETELGDLVTDAMLARHPGAVLAVINGGGIGSAVPSAFLPTDHTLRRPDTGYQPGPPYDVVREDARRVLRFGNRDLTIQMTGAQIWQLLEFSVSQPLPSTQFFQVAGIRFHYRPSATMGSRVVSVSLAGGGAIMPDSTPYTVVMPDFVYYGGTGATFIADGTGVPGDDLADVLADYLASGSACRTPALSGRIVADP